MFNKILVPIAFSKYTPGILRFAVKIAEPLGAELYIINVINERDLEAVERISSHGYKVDGEKYVDIIRQERETALNKLFEEVGISQNNHTFVFRVGDPTNELLKTVVKEEIDLVIMGTKAKDIRHIFTGSVAEKMFRRCPVSIISYRDDEIAQNLEKRIKKELTKKD